MIIEQPLQGGTERAGLRVVHEFQTGIARWSNEDIRALDCEVRGSAGGRRWVECLKVGRMNIRQFASWAAGPCKAAVSKITRGQRDRSARWRQRCGGFHRTNTQLARRRRFGQGNEVGNVGGEVIPAQP